MAFTPEQKEEYINKQGNFCPYCGSDDIEAEPLEPGGDEAWAVVTCDVCGKEWRDIYHLTDIEEIE